MRGIPRSGIRDFFDVVQSMDNVISLGIGEDFAVEGDVGFLQRGDNAAMTTPYFNQQLRRNRVSQE